MKTNILEADEEFFACLKLLERTDFLAQGFNPKQLDFASKLLAECFEYTMKNPCFDGQPEITDKRITAVQNEIVDAYRQLKGITKRIRP